MEYTSSGFFPLPIEVLYAFGLYTKMLQLHHLLLWMIANLLVEFLISMPTSDNLTLLVLNLQNMANPTALLLSAVSMLRHLELNDKADQVQNAVLDTIAEGKYRTIDLGGNASTTDFTKAICDHL